MHSSSVNILAYLIQVTDLGRSFAMQRAMQNTHIILTNRTNHTIISWIAFVITFYSVIKDYVDVPIQLLSTVSIILQNGVASLQERPLQRLQDDVRETRSSRSAAVFDVSRGETDGKGVPGSETTHGREVQGKWIRLVGF